MQMGGAAITVVYPLRSSKVIAPEAGTRRHWLGGRVPSLVHAFGLHSLLLCFFLSPASEMQVR